MRTIMLFVVLAALAGCGPPANRYPTDFEANFKSACARSKGPEGYCDCVWRRIAAEIPVEDFIGFDAAATSGQPHPVQARVEEFARRCMANPSG